MAVPEDGSTDVRTELARAGGALARLREAPPRASVPKLFAYVCWAGAALVVAGLVGHTFLESGGFQVDETSVALLVLAVVLPFAPRLRVIEFGGAKAEWQADAAATLQPLLTVVAAQHEALTRLYADAPSSDSGEEAAGPAGVAPAPAPAQRASRRRPGPPPHAPRRPLRTVLWVDDNPAGNSYEVQALRALSLEVVQVASTADAETRLDEADIDLVITDLARTEQGRRHGAAGRAVLELVGAHELGVPVVFYGSPEGVARQGDSLAAAGAVAVTASPSELLDTIRELVLAQLGDVVADRLERAGAAPDEIDDVEHLRSRPLLADVGGAAMIVAVSHWLRRPKVFALDRVLEGLTAAQVAARADAVWLVAQSSVFSDAQRARAAERHVLLLSFDQLEEQLTQAIRTPGWTPVVPGRA